jgi:hypothetical protein
MSPAAKNTGESSQDLKPRKHDRYKDPVNAMLQIATFAGAITFTVVLAPRDGDHGTRGIAEIAYANSLFIGGIMGCVLIRVSIELYDASIERNEASTERDDDYTGREDICEKQKGIIIEKPEASDERKAPRQPPKRPIPKWLRISSHEWLIPAEVGVVGMTLFVAFYLMLHASGLFLQYNGPFIVGSILYLGFGIPAFILWVGSLWADSRNESERSGERSEEKSEKSKGKMENV